MDLRIIKIVSRLTITHHKGEGKYCGNTIRSLVIDASGVNEHVELNGEKGESGWDNHGGLEVFAIAGYVPDMDASAIEEYCHHFSVFGYEFETERVVYNVPSEGMKLSIKVLQPCQ